MTDDGHTGTDASTATETGSEAGEDGGGRLPLTRRTTLGLTGLALGGAALGGTTVTSRAQEQDSRTYRVTVSNLTEYQPFTPPAVAAHDPSVEVFSVGSEANEPTRAIAENGNLTPLVEFVNGTDAVDASAVGPRNDAGDPIPLVPGTDPGDTGLPYFASLEFTTRNRFLSFISMLIATNDGFTGLDTVRLPGEVNQSKTLYAASYDAGTEQNTERYRDLVPPAQGLTGIDWEGGGSTGSDDDISEDGVVTPHPGIAGVGDLRPELYDWEDPVALVHVERQS